METENTAERGADWTLVWADEFDGPEIDASVWTFEKGFVRNHEAQYYTDRPENARIEDGRLVIVARKEPWPNAAFDPADPATGKHASKGDRIGGVSPSDGFHLYGIEWDENAIVYTFDGRPYNVQPVADLTDASGFNPFRQPHYLRLNLAIGGDWGGMKGIDDAPFPIRYEIDFVRLYKRAGQS